MGSQPFLIESLEDRKLLSAAISVVNDTLIIRGTPRADEIVVNSITPPVSVITEADHSANSSTQVPSLLVTINGRQRTINAQKIRRIRVEAGAGDDSVIMTHSNIPLAFQDVEQSLPSTILGGTGNDTLIGGRGADSISGGAGRDSINGWEGNDTLDGDANSDSITGSAGQDIMRGGAGDDRLLANDEDQISGGEGLDIVGTDQSIVIPNAAPPTASGIEASTDLLDESTPIFEISRLGTLTIYGTRRSDNIRLEFFAQFKPFRCNLDINGHSVSIDANLVKRIQIQAGDGDDTIALAQENGQTVRTNGSTPIFIPVTLMGGNGNDHFTGAIGSDYINGGAGNDFLAGSGGNDTLDGGDGTDTLRGDQGDDVLLNGESNLQGPEPSDTVIVE